MKRSLLGVLCIAALEAFHPVGLGAQSCTLNVPSTLSGYQGQQYSVALSGVSNPYKVQYITDAYGNFNPGLGAGSERGISLGPTSGPIAFVLPINSSWNANGPRLVTANVYDVLNNLLATCTATGTSANAWPVASTPTLLVATGTAIGSPWSGSVTVTPTIGGTGGDFLQCYYTIDGKLTTQEGLALACTAAFAATFDTTKYTNGPHVVCVYVLDQSGGLTHTPGYEGQAGEWCRTVTFTNTTSLGVGPAINNDKIYLPIASTFSLTGAQLNADGSTTAASPLFFSANPAVASVDQSTGVVTAVANGATLVSVLIPLVSGTDLVTNPSGNATSASAPFGLGEGTAQWGCYISSGSGFTLGFHPITLVQYLGGTSTRIYGALIGQGGSLSGGTFQCGPYANAWIFVNPTNTMPYIGSDASINTSYNPSNAAVLHGIFAGINLLTSDQPYNYQGHANGATYEFNNIGKWWAFEIGAGCLSGCSFTDTIPTAGATYTTWQSTLNGSISTATGFLNSQPNLYLYLNWSNITGANVNTYGAAQGPGASLSPPAFQYMIQQYMATGKVLGGYWHDEIPQQCPGCGPIVYDPAGTGTGQSWLISITATGGGGAGETCTATVGSHGYTIFGNFIVHGSAVTNMNSVYPATYNDISGGPGFHFACPNVADGIYNNSNDPGFTLEPMSNGWINSGGAYVASNAWALMRSQINAVTGHFGFSGSPIGTNINTIVATNGGTCNVNAVLNGLRSWGGWSQYTNGGLQAGDYSDIYPAVGGLGYIVSHASLNSVLNAGLWMGYTLRNLYGCGYSPDLPMNALTDATLNYYGTKGAPVALTSCAGNLCTFTAPVDKIIPNILPGQTRMYVTGATDVSSPQDSTNNNFVIYDCPTSTTCHVDLAATTSANNSGFSGSNSGTITLEDGAMLASTGMSATGTQNCTPSGAPNVTTGTLCLVDQMRWGTIPNATILLRKRGQTFSFNGSASGSGAAYFNANTFRIAPDWLNITTAPSTIAFYRQLPILNSTGGTAFIIPDNNYHKGLSASTGPGGTNVGPSNSSSGDLDPEWMHANVRECMYLRCSGERIYQIGAYQSGYSDQIGLTPPGAFQVQWGPKVFNDNHIYQITVNQHFENGAAVPGFKAHEFTAMDWNANVKYWQQPRLNAPSIGKSSEIDCGAAAGSYGDILGCTNMTNGPRTITIPTTPYLQSGQNFIQYTSDAYGIGAITVVSAGTSSVSLTLDHGQSVNLKFPANFGSELQQPSVSVQLADVASATGVTIRFAYDPYYLDVAGNVKDCGSTFPCTPSWDRNIGPIYFRLIYRGSSSQVLATSAVQTY